MSEVAVEVFESEEEMTASMVRPLPALAARYVRTGQATYTPVTVLEVRGKAALCAFPDGEKDWVAADSALHTLPPRARLL